MDDKKRMVLEWLCELEKYAKEQKLSMRIMDSLSECKEEAEGEVVDWDKLIPLIDDLMESVSDKLPDTEVAVYEEGQVTVEDVKAEITKMVGRCHKENEASVNNIGTGKSTIVKETFRKMREITKTKAHYDEITNENLYLEYYQKIKTYYMQNMGNIVKELITEITGNCGHMVENMRSMFQSIGGHASGISNEKFYYEFEDRRKGIENKFLKEVDTETFGGNKFIEFGEKTREFIKGVVKKHTGKKKLLSWLPLVFLLGIMIVNGVITQIETKEAENKAATEQSAEETDENILSKLIEKGKELDKSKGDGGVGGKLLSAVLSVVVGLLISLAAMRIFIILLMVVIYIAYLKIIQNWCKRKICRECGEYLELELNQFEQNTDMLKVIDDTLEVMVKDYEQQYVDILDNLFKDTKFDAENEENKTISQFMMLKETWSKLRYE